MLSSNSKKSRRAPLDFQPVPRPAPRRRRACAMSVLEHIERWPVVGRAATAVITAWAIALFVMFLLDTMSNDEGGRW